MKWRGMGRLLAITTLAFGCATAQDEAFTNPSRAPRIFGSSGRGSVYVVMGDSTAAGRGANYEKGIAIATAQHMATSHRVVLTNLGVSGARLRDVVTEQLAAAEQLRPDVVLISVGANDVTHLTPLRSMKTSLLEILRRLRRSNENVAIVVTGSPEIGAPPRVPRVLRPVA